MSRRCLHSPLCKTPLVRAFTTISFLHGISVAVCAVVMFALSFNSQYDDFLRMRAYGVIFFVSGLLFVWFAWDGIFFEDGFELLAVCIASAVCVASVVLCASFSRQVILAFAVYRAFFSTWSVTPDTWVLFFVSACALVAYLILCPLLYSRFGWTVAAAVGADAKLQRCFMNLRLFVAMLKFDGYLFMIFAVLVAFFFSMEFEIFAVVGSVFVEILWVLLGWFAFSRERKPVMVVWYLLTPLAPIYFAVMVYMLLTFPNPGNFPNFLGIATAGASALVRVFVIVLAIRFHHMLKQAGASLWETRCFMRESNQSLI